MARLQTGRTLKVSTSYKVQFSKEALKYFEKLDKQIQKRIAKVVEMLKQNPYAVPHVKPMEGTAYEQYRVRIGDIRMIYRLHNDQLLVIIVKIGPRGDVYK